MDETVCKMKWSEDKGEATALLSSDIPQLEAEVCDGQITIKRVKA